MDTKSLLILLTCICLIAAAHAQRIHFPHPEAIAFLPGTPVAIQSGDINTDGVNDLLVCYADPGAVYWYESDSTGLLDVAAHQIDTQLTEPEQPELVDLDSDGDLDLVLISPADGVLAVFENQSAAFVYHEVLVDENLRAVCVSDLNRDGMPDLVCGYASGHTLGRCLQLPGLTFTAPSELSSYTFGLGSVLSVDLDLDGAQDLLALTSSSGYLVSWRNSGLGAMGDAQQVTSARHQRDCIDLADLDQDGDPDIVCWSLTQDCLVWYENRLPEAAGWVSHELSTATEDTRRVLLADCDGDEAPDLLTGNDAGVIQLLRNPQQTGEAWPVQQLFSHAGCVQTLTLLCEEPVLTPLVATQNQVSLLLRDSLAAQLQPVVFQPQNALSATMCDTDLDGEMEYLVCDSADSCLFLYERDTSDAIWYKAERIAECLPLPERFYWGDLDGDEDADFIYGRDEAGWLLWHENGHPGGNWCSHTLPTQLRPWNVSIEDFDLDGDLDVFVSEPAEGVLLWNADAQGSMIPSTEPFDDELGVGLLRTGDLNADGLQDYVAIVDGCWLQIWMRTAQGWITEEPGVIILLSPVYDMQLQDLDHDGDLDILIFDQGFLRARARVFENRGVAGFVLSSLPVGGDQDSYGITSMIDADLDGDFDLCEISHSGLCHYRNRGGMLGLEARVCDQLSGTAPDPFEWVQLPGDPRPCFLFCDTNTGRVMLSQNHSFHATSPNGLKLEQSGRDVLLSWDDQQLIDHWLVYRVSTPWAEPGEEDLIAQVYAPRYRDYNAMLHERAWYRVVAVSTME